MTTASAAIHSTRYQRWSGKLRSGRWTWLAMVFHGVLLRFKDTRNLLLMLPSLGLVAATCGIFYVLSLLEDLVGTRQAAGIYDFVQTFLRVDISDAARIGEYRLPLWQSVFVLMTKVQLFYVLIVIGRMGPGLIADDLKSKALPIYFARPITPLTYLLGKWLTIGVFIACAMWLPNLLALAGGIFIADGPATWGQTWGLAWDLTVSGVGVMVVGGLLILALSSLTSDKRFVLVSWLALMLLPSVAHKILRDLLAPEATMRLRFLGSISPGDDVVALTTWLFGLRETWAATGLPEAAYQTALGDPVEPLYPALVLLALTVAAAAVCYRRIVVFSRSAANI